MSVSQQEQMGIVNTTTILLLFLNLYKKYFSKYQTHIFDLLPNSASFNAYSDLTVLVLPIYVTE